MKTVCIYIICCFFVNNIFAQNDFSDNSKQHTASSQVHILDTAFYIPQLNRYRKIWIYLPKDYATSTKKYPVLYMQDGQNLFDKFTSPYGEWGVDECVDSLINKGTPACIIIGVENGGDKRLNEYTPYNFKIDENAETISAEGNVYINFITTTLKPFVDKNYRTLSSKENTIIAGSSMGGLISYYAAIKYPNVFGKAGIFSPSFWVSSKIKDLTDSVYNRLNSKFFFCMGGQEGQKYIDDMNEVAQKLGTNSATMIYSIVDEDGQHSEKTWGNWFPQFYKWIMADGYNYVIKLEE
jgi:predicted alpha/beta superfamily hydrolase